VANKIAAGEVVERPASVAKELVENAIDAGAKSVRITITQGGRKLVAVQDDGCGMTRDDAVLSLERQATSKILDVTDIEQIDTLGFRGEAIPSIASVSRLSITTRRADSDEGTFLQVNAGTLAEVRAAGCPPGTLVEVRDLFCNVPARRKFLRAYVTEESHIRQVFTVHALAHPALAFSLTVDGRELYRLAPAATLKDRVRELFGPEFLETLLPIGLGLSEGRGEDTASTGNAATGPSSSDEIRVTGFIERPNLACPTRRDQYVFINGRPATAPSVAYALREAYPRRQGDVRPAVILFIDLPPSQVDVNVHPTKREVRFRDNTAVKQAILAAVETSLSPVARASSPCSLQDPDPVARASSPWHNEETSAPLPAGRGRPAHESSEATAVHLQLNPPTSSPAPSPAPVQHEIEFAVEPDAPRSKPWNWFRYLAQSDSGYLLVETDTGIVTINPIAARERIAYEQLLARGSAAEHPCQTLLIPETVQFSPVDFARLGAALTEIRAMGFQLEAFGRDTYKIDAVPQLIGSLSPSAILTTIARDLADSATRRGGDRWREELVAKSVARSFAGASTKLTPEGATKLVEELCACRMPYVCPRGKPVMIFTSTTELNRKFARD